MALRGKNGLEDQRKEFASSNQAMRISVAADRYLIDGVIVKCAMDPKNKRWMVVSVGNGMRYEDGISHIALAKKINANILLYNYACVGRSTSYMGSLPSRHAMVTSHRTMLSFLEEGMGAKEIVDFGWSIGGGVMGQNYLEQPRTRAKYIPVFYKTFASIEEMGRNMLGNFGAWGVKFLGWNYSPLGAIETLKDKKNYPAAIFIETPNDGDGVIPETASIGNHLRTPEKAIKIASSYDHNASISEEYSVRDTLAAKINDAFKGVNFSL